MTSNKCDDSALASKDTESSKSKSTQSSKSKRGRVCLTALAQRRAKGIFHEVEFNNKGQPIGKVGAEMQSYIGMLTREHVKITYKTWRQVPENVKEFIWESVNTSYIVPYTWKYRCLASASVKWRTWKNRLYTDYILPNKNNPFKLKKPPVDSGIIAIDWNQFVASRTTPEFKKLSEEQKKRRNLNVYPHRLSRKGYARLAEDMKDELNGDEDVDRCKMWKKARLPKEGCSEDDNLNSAIQRIDDYIRAKEEGNLKPDSDLLACALDKGERTGRVLGIGAYVTNSQYFRTPRERRQKDNVNSVQELEEAKKKIALCEDLIHGLVDRFGKLEAAAYAKEKENTDEGIGSCSMRLSRDNEKDQEDEELICVDKSATLLGKQVALMERSTKRIVGYGTVIVSGDKLHGVPMPKGCLRVSIDGVVGENESLPFRVSNEIDTVESAIGTHVAWPAHLVVEKNEKPIKKKTGKMIVNEPKVENYASLPTLLKALYCAMEKFFEEERGLHIAFDVDVFGVDFSIWIVKEDVIPFCNLNPITGNCIVIYVWHLYRKLKDDCFLFVNPFSVAYAVKVSSEERACKLAERLYLATENQLVFVPCNVGGHWILTIIEPYKDRVYLMDPLSHENRDATWKSVVDTAMKSFKVHIKSKHFKKAPHWEIIKGPLQPDLKQCGYYVMRFMKEIVQGFQKDNSISISSLFPKQESYSKGEINEIRDDWATTVIDHLTVTGT